MAIVSLHSAASALSALNTSMDVTANNLANVNTFGFKPSRANFQDLLYVERQQPGVTSSSGDQRPTGLYVGLGVQVSGTQVEMRQGVPVSTERPLDVMIEGQGFFRVQVQPDLGGGTAYTRAGNFAVNSEGRITLATDQGRYLVDDLTIPEGASGLSIGRDGTVSATLPGELAPTELGQIQIATFINPAGLKQVGENLFTETGASGPAVVGDPQSANLGSLIQGYLENSAVDPTRELIDLIKTQRAFEMNSNTIRAADETLRTVSNLRRG